VLASREASSILAYPEGRAALAEALGMRGYDAVHLASSFALGPDTTVIT